jgi:Cof subfamily protein (haloacid dehalogenase superfamily)
MVQMIAMDLDGTLLSPDKNISGYTLSVIERCKQNSIIIAIATGRSEAASKRYIDLVKPDIIISNGGALVTMNNKIMYKKLLPSKVTNKIIKECIENIHVGEITVETETNYYVSYKDAPDNADYVHGQYLDFSKNTVSDAYKITVEIDNEATVLAFAEKYKECEITGFAGEKWYRFANREANKIDAIKAVIKELPVSLNNVAAFGDDYNDIGMIKECGVGIVMENGIKALKNSAKYICKDNNNDGVGKWIEEHILHSSFSSSMCKTRR